MSLIRYEWERVRGYPGKRHITDMVTSITLCGIKSPECIHPGIWIEGCECEKCKEVAEELGIEAQ